MGIVRVAGMKRMQCKIAAVGIAAIVLTSVTCARAQDVTDLSFESDVLGSKVPVVVHFRAEWCGPCRMILPTLKEIGDARDGGVKVLNIDVDQNPATPAKYGVMTIPTLILFKEGAVASRQVGAAPLQKLEQWIESIIR
jgi:thioredoxin 1